MNKEINMTKREINMADVFSKVSQKRLSQTKAARILGISVRHTQRLYADFKKLGLIALESRQRGKPSNHQLPKIITTRVRELITCEKYTGFGPTFMCEKLRELHSIIIGVETTRQLMIEEEVWEDKRKKSPVVHQQRKRRARAGELSQIDGSPHLWFEERGNPCCLIVFIDDATGRTYGKFFKTETTLAYMIVLLEYIKKYGRMRATYSDRHGIFRVNMPNSTKRESITHFGRVLKELGIISICANSPQGKGRVERVNRTLQDRLVKELRLAGINDIEEGNKYLPSFLDKFNEQFSIEPRDKQDDHRPLLPEHDLTRIFTCKYTRKISKNLELQFNNTFYQIIQEKRSLSLRNTQVTILKELDGNIAIEYKGKLLPYKILDDQEYSGKIVDAKEIDHFLRESKEEKPRKVSYDHPWNRQGRAEAKIRQYKRDNYHSELGG